MKQFNLRTNNVNRIKLNVPGCTCYWKRGYAHHSSGLVNKFVWLWLSSNAPHTSHTDTQMSVVLSCHSICEGHHPEHIPSHVLKDLKTPFTPTPHLQTASSLCHIAKGGSISLAMHIAPQHSLIVNTHTNTWGREVEACCYGCPH